MKPSFLAWPRRVAAIVAASLIFVLSACGGGGGTSGPIADGGIGGTGISFGPVTGFGSVFVNGTAFDTGDALILVNGETVTEASLTEGMLVRVEGEWTATGTGTATQVEYRNDIRGPVQTAVFDPLTGVGTLTVLGQTVHFNKQTVFRGVTREAIAVGDNVAISGWYLESGKFLASLVRWSGTFLDGGEAEVKGIIEDLDTVAQSFRIGGLEIVYSPATEIEMKDDRDFLRDEDNGAFVEVEGRFSGGVLVADEIEQEDDRNLLRASGGDDVEIEGPISSVNPGSRTFVLNGTTVQVTNGTEFDDGLRESDLQPGLQVSVEGEWDANGFLVAEEIESRSADSEVEARILGIDPGALELNVGGVTVRVTSRTLIVDEDDDRLSFSNLRVGDTVEVDGFRRENSDGSVYLEAIKIERDDEDDDDEFELTGRVDAVDRPNRFRVLGVWMNVYDETEWEDGLDDIDDLQPGMRVEVKYELHNGQFVALEVEREDD